MADEVSEKELVIRAAKYLAIVHCNGFVPEEWRYDGTHAAGNQMLEQAETVIRVLKANGWGPNG